MQLNTKKYDAFSSHIFDYACLGFIAIEEVRNCTKTVYIKSIFENVAGGRMHTQRRSQFIAIEEVRNCREK